MESAYLALRWNNHSKIFTKLLSLLREQEAYTDVSLSCEGRFYPAHKFVLSTCSDYFKAMFSNTPCKHPVIFLNDVGKKDIESLLDFMYKGEVHVPQSDLGSLLRTAEALQVKGLAIPDDIAQSTAKSPTGDDDASSTVPLLNTAFPVKRKRASEASRRDEFPKLTPSQELSSQKSKLKSTKNRVASMPVLKRFKMSFEKSANLTTDAANNLSNNNESTTENINHNFNSNSPSSEEQSSENRESTTNLQDQNALIPISRIKEEINESNCDEDHPIEEEEIENDSFEHGNETERQYYEDEEEDKCADENSPHHPSEGDENLSLANSEISASNVLSTSFLQTELLQVDLSEDGTQFIIGPGVVGGEVSRASSTAEEEAEVIKKPFLCVLCGNTFTRKDNLVNHLKTHTGDRPYMCKYCRKCFARKDYLKQHERIHTGEKPYPCTICDRAFTRKEGLMDHMRCHSDFREFSCETCGKSFRQKCGLRFHKRSYNH